MIDVIIPVYNCDIDLLLMNLALQTSKDFKVIIVDDCSSIDYKEILEYYSKYLDIKYIRNKKNMGAGLSRQVGIDNSNNPYIMFIDSDDLLYNVDSIKLLLDRIPFYDIVSALEYDEYNDVVLLNHSTIHSKIYKREFLDKYNIRFNNTRYHEDNYFNNLVLLNNPKDLELLIINYIYRYNKNSLTHIDDKEFERVEILIKNISELLSKDYNEDRVNKLLLEKFDYLNRLYEESDNNKKEILSNWIDKYLNKYKYLFKKSKKELINILGV